MWVGPRLSTMERLCITSYLHHGHPFHLYVYQETEGVPEGTTIKDGNEIIPAEKIFVYEGAGFGHKSYAGFADMFRYKLLFEKGNWWVDTDSICLKPFDFADEYVFSTEFPAPGSLRTSNINCGNLKAPAHSGIYKWLCERAQQLWKPNMLWGTIGPALMKEAVRTFEFDRFVKDPEVFCPIPYDYYCMSMIKRVSNQFITEKSYAAHLWNEAWRAQNYSKDATYEPNCIYEQLKKQYGLEGTGPVCTPPVPLLESAQIQSQPSPQPAVQNIGVRQPVNRLRRVIIGGHIEFVPEIVDAGANRRCKVHGNVKCPACKNTI